MRAAVIRGWCWALVALAGCSSGEPPTDSGADTAAPDAGGLVVAAPMPPSLPRMTPCPSGYSESMIAGGVAICEPWPLDAPRAGCADHEARFVGERGCARLGAACPSDGLPASVGDGAIFVSEGATGGTGTRTNPFGTISEALDVASPGDTIAIGVGDYDEMLTPAGDVTLVGACVEGTVIRSSTPNVDRGVVGAVGGASVTIQNLTIGPSESLGVSASGVGSTLTISEAAIVETAIVGLFAELEGRLVVDGVVVRRTHGTIAFPFGRGVSLQSAATASMDRLAVEGGYEAGIYLIDPGTSLELTGGSVLDIASLTSGRGSGLSVLRGASVDVERTVFDGMVDAGVIASGEDVSVVLTDVIVRNVAGADFPLSPGRGMNVQEGATLEGHRLLIRGAHETGVVAGLGNITIEDLVITEIEPSLAGRGGRGMTVQDGGATDVDRVFIGDVREAAVLANGASARLRDLSVSGVQASDNGLGRGISVQGGAAVAVERVDVRDLVEIGVFVAGDRSHLDLTDLVVDGVRSRAADGVLGRGVSMQTAATASLQRVEIQNVRDVAIAVLDRASVVGADVRLESVTTAECASSSCGEFGQGGHALGAYIGASADLMRFVISSPALCGIHVTDGSVITLSDGEVRGAEIGACVQSDAQPVEALSGSVRYVDNEQNLVATTLPVPGAADEIAP